MIELSITEAHIEDDHERRHATELLSDAIVSGIDNGDIGQYYDLTEDNIVMEVNQGQIELSIRTAYVPDAHERYSGEKELKMELFNWIPETTVGERYALTSSSIDIKLTRSS